MNTDSRPPLSPDLPEDIRKYLETVPPVTPAMLAELAAANRALEADPAWQADYLKSLFVEKMLQALEERGESKAQVAGRLGKSRQYVQKLFNEDKRVNFTLETLCAVAHALGRRVNIEITPAPVAVRPASKPAAKRSARAVRSKRGPTRRKPRRRSFSVKAAPAR